MELALSWVVWAKSGAALRACHESGSQNRNQGLASADHLTPGEVYRNVSDILEPLAKDEFDYCSTF
jgi:hypothetical protein